MEKEGSDRARVTRLANCAAVAVEEQQEKKKEKQTTAKQNVNGQMIWAALNLMLSV